MRLLVQFTTLWLVISAALMAEGEPLTITSQPAIYSVNLFAQKVKGIGMPGDLGSGLGMGCPPVSPACRALATYPRSDPNNLSALGGDNRNICDGLSAPDSKGDTCRPTQAQSNRYSKSHKEDSVQSMSKDGHALITSPSKDKNEASKKQEEIKKFEALYQSTRNKVASSCCGSDSRCKQAMLATPVVFCKPDKNSSCADSTAFRHPSDNDFFTTVKSKIPDMSRASKNPSTKSYLQRQMEYVTPLTKIGSYIRDAVGIKSDYSKQPLMIGQIIASPYTTNNELDVDQSVLEHELFHACSSIKRQEILLSAQDPELFLAAFRSIYAESNAVACSADNAKSAYDQLFQGQLSQFMKTKESIDSTMKCFLKVANTAASGNSTRAKCENGCPWEYLEEAFAELSRLNWSGNAATASTERLCWTFRDSLHGFDRDFAECIAQNSQSFRNDLHRALGCIN